MKITVKVSGLDAEEIEVLGRWLILEGEPAADIRAAVNEALEDEAYGLIASLLEEAGV